MSAAGAMCCRNHYVEYLSRRTRALGVDPLPLLGVEDLETLVRRAALRPPPRPYGSLEGLYRRALTEVRCLVAGRTTWSDSRTRHARAP